MVRTRLNIGCRYSTPVLERPLHPTRSQFKPQPSQTQAPVTPATEPERRAGGGLTTIERSAILANALGVRGTPAFVIGDDMIRGAPPLEQFRAAIADAWVAPEGARNRSGTD